MAEDRDILLSAKGLSGGYGRVPILHGIDLDVGERQLDYKVVTIYNYLCIYTSIYIYTLIYIYI